MQPLHQKEQNFGGWSIPIVQRGLHKTYHPYKHSLSQPGVVLPSVEAKNVIVSTGHSVKSYPWTIDTKYYSAEVEFLLPTSESAEEVASQIKDLCEAFILIYHPEQVSLHLCC